LALEKKSRTGVRIASWIEKHELERVRIGIAQCMGKRCG